MSFHDFMESNVFFLIVAVLLAFGLYQTLGVALGTEVPMVSVVSPSMKPTLDVGDLILVRGSNIENLEAGKDGSILVYNSKHISMPIIHRVVAKDKDSVETKGDNNRNQLITCEGSGQPIDSANDCGPGSNKVNIEKNITQDQILGEAFFVIPKVGYLKLYPACLFLRATSTRNNQRLEYTCG